MRRFVRSGSAFALGILFASAIAVSLGQTTGGFPSQPTFQSVRVSATNPIITWNETDGAADNRVFRIRNDAEDLSFQACNDALACNTYSKITRTGNQVDSISLVATAINATGAFSLTGAATITSSLDVNRIGVGIGGVPAGAGEIDAGGTITARGNVSLLATSTTNPTVELTMSDATADNKRWQIRASVETLLMRALNDAGSTTNNFLEVERTGAVIDSVNLKGTAIQVNGTTLVQSGTYTGAVTGCTTDPAPVIFWTRIGDGTNAQVTMQIPGFSCTSNTTAMTITGAPVAIRPNADAGNVQTRGQDNSAANANCFARMTSAGTLVLRQSGSDTGWTAAGVKGFTNPVSYTYQLDNT